MCQMNVKNAFLYGDLQEEVYMEQPLSYVAQGKIRSVVPKKLYMVSSKVQERGLRSSALLSPILIHRCHSDHSVFVRRIKSGIVVLVVYVDILLTDSDPGGY